jgi:CheY-like chemotaxis protein/anti-sigma regulatory factor (Ser/Thr protein kinase)
VAEKRILVVDDDPDAHHLLNALLRAESYQLDSAFDGRQALSLLGQHPYDLVLTDIHMPGMDGLTLLDQIHESYPETPVVVMTADGTPAAIVRSIRNQAYGYLTKPLAREPLIETIHRALSLPAAPGDIEVISARPGWVSLQVRCKLSIAERLAQFFRDLPAGLAPGEKDLIAEAFRELLVNSIEHGGRSDPSQKVSLTYVRTARAIIFYIRDPGEGFSFDQLPHAAVSNGPENPLGHAEVRSRLGLRPGGFGILLTRKFADELLYSEKGNEVMLIKYLS